MPTDPAQRRPEDATEQATAAIREATRAVNEAARTASEASSQAAERQADAAVQVTRTYMDESQEATGQLFAAWASGTEAMWKTYFDMQAATLGVGLALLDAAARGNRLVMQQWTEGARQAMLEPMKAGTKAAEKLAESARSERGRRQ
jgi:hypothetical protein